MRMIKCGWKNADDKMPMKNCQWHYADDKIPITKPSHRIKVGRSPVFYIQSQTGQDILKPARRIQNNPPSQIITE